MHQAAMKCHAQNSIHMCDSSLQGKTRSELTLASISA